MLNYNNITNDFKNDKQNAKVSLAKYYTYKKNNIIPMEKMLYLISLKKNMKLLWLSKTFNENVYINPRVNGTHVFYHAIYKNKGQSRIIFLILLNQK